MSADTDRVKQQHLSRVYQQKKWKKRKKRGLSLDNTKKVVHRLSECMKHQLPQKSQLNGMDC